MNFPRIGSHLPSLLVALFTSAGNLSALTYLDAQAFNAANPGLTVQGFEGLAPAGGLILYPQGTGGITMEGGRGFTTLNPNLVQISDRTNSWGPGFTQTSDVAFVNSTTGFALRITFDQRFAAVGLRVKIGLTDGTRARVRGFSNGTVVGDETVTTNNLFTTFVGFSDARGIDVVEVSSPTENSGLFVFIDDLHYGQLVVDPGEPLRPIEWLPVGRAGNPPDGNGFGRVDYNYRIAKHEVTNVQYVEFLNAVARSDPHGLYRATMSTSPRGGITRTGASGSYQYAAIKNMGYKPVANVSFFDAIRMANWMHNGKGNGSTETGAYNLAAEFPVRLPAARVFLPSEDEWYKAAYHDPTPGAGGGDNYWLYATRSNAAPALARSNGSGEITNPGSNVANYNSGASWNSLNGHYTSVGGAGPLSESFYGTADQSGNVTEWNETIFQSTRRGFRGGAWNLPAAFIQSAYQDYNVPTVENETLGFRLAAAAPTASVSMQPGSVIEDSDDLLVVRVSRTGETDSPLVVNLGLAGQATPGVDYLPAAIGAGSVTLPAGSDHMTFTLDPVADNLDEADETVVVSLLPGETYNIAAPGSATGRILDDDFTPVAVADGGYEVVEDSALSVPAAAGVLANDTDQDDGDGPAHLTAELVTGVSHGVLVLAADGSFTYTPAKDYFGADSFSYRASDGTNRSAAVGVAIQVTERIDLQVTSSGTPEVVGAPGDAVHGITVRNLGPSAATSVVIDLNRIFPAGVTADPPQVSTGTVVGERWTLNLAEGGSATVQATYRVSAAARGGIDTLITRARATASDQPRTATDDDATEISASIISPADLGILEATATPLVRAQSGLLTQEITVTNRNPLPLAGFRLVIGGLPADVAVHNRHGVDAEGRAYIDVPGFLAAGAEVRLRVEFYRPTRNFNFEPAYSIAATLAEPPAEPVTAPQGAGPARVTVLDDGDVLVEFASLPGTSYAIEYSADTTTWKRVVATVTATANRTQWIDSGPPKTAVHPSAASSRFYRIVTLPE